MKEKDGKWMKKTEWNKRTEELPNKRKGGIYHKKKHSVYEKSG